MLQSHYPTPLLHHRYPVAVSVAAYGRFGRGDLEGAIQLGEQAVAAARRLGVDTSGLAERALGNAWFYRGDYEQGAEWTDRMIASAQSGSPARLAHALYMRSVAFTMVGDTVRGAQFAANSSVAAAESGSPTAHAQALYAQGLSRKSTSPKEASRGAPAGGRHCQRRGKSMDSSFCPHRGVVASEPAKAARARLWRATST